MNSAESGRDSVNVTVLVAHVDGDAVRLQVTLPDGSVQDAWASRSGFPHEIQTVIRQGARLELDLKRHEALEFLGFSVERRASGEIVVEDLGDPELAADPEGGHESAPTVRPVSPRDLARATRSLLSTDMISTPPSLYGGIERPAGKRRR